MMYYYVEELEIQSPEHRSVALASLTSFFSLAAVTLCGYAALFPWEQGYSLLGVVVSTLNSFLVLYFGCLLVSSRRLIRVLLLTAFSFLIFIGMTLFLLMGIGVVLLTCMNFKPG